MKQETVKVLLIEDDEDDYFLTSELLGEVRETRYDIRWVPKYSDALATMLTGDFDVCLIDYMLGQGTGIELLREALASGCHIPMILLTGQGDKDIDIEATEAGAADYLVKGTVEASVLERAIRYAIANGRMIRQMRESENRFRSLVESAKDAIVLTDLKGKIISWNDSAETIFGYSKAEAATRSFSELFPLVDGHPDSKAFAIEDLLRSNSKAVELKGIKKDGEIFPLEISISSWETIDGVFYSGIIRDITDRKSLEEQLTHQALHDPLTKLANRVLFRDRVEHALSKIVRHKTAVAVLFLDLDNFKTINDSLGHARGDILLVSVAERLRSCLRGSDTPARLGGDEFAILIEDATHPDDAIYIVERIYEVLRTPFDIDGNIVFVEASIGIAATTTGSENPEELLRNADVAMYKAKGQGKGRFVFFEMEMREALLERIELEADLRCALENNELALLYQPIINLETNSVIGMEALVRWNHPKLGLIPPDKFIPIAEEANLIVPIGRWILDEACRAGSEWVRQFRGQHDLSITVNLSIRQFQQIELVRIVAETLERSGLPPQFLILEITETLMIQNTEAMIEKLHELKSLGVRLAIDDFGTGYSSLSYLQRFPIDILKIDKSFIDKINQGKEGRAVARAIIMMGDSLNLRVIAEGIENPEQVAALKHLGCEAGQGFFFAKPISEPEMSSMLAGAESNSEIGGQPTPAYSPIAPDERTGPSALTY
jgi:diguanylate cyclase (GGDEF)-like protein/PAS domain S-box-containing protein